MYVGIEGCVLPPTLYRSGYIQTSSHPSIYQSLNPSIPLSHVPAHAGEVNEVHLSSPGIVGRWSESKTRVLLVEVHCRNGVPPGIEIRDVEPDHEVLGKGLLLESLQDELRCTITEAGVAGVLPEFFEAQIDEETASLLVAGAAGNEGEKRQGLQLAHVGHLSKETTLSLLRRKLVRPLAGVSARAAKDGH